EDLGGGAAPARAECRRAMGPAAVLRRLHQIRAEGAGDPGWRQQGRLPARAARDLYACAFRLGGDPDQRRLVSRQYQRGYPLYFRDLVAHGLRRDHGRLGVELEISVPRRASVGCADGLLRSFDRLRVHHRALVRGLAESEQYRAGAGRTARIATLVLAATAAHV